MEKERSMAKCRRSQEVSKEKWKIMAKEQKSKGVKTDIWLVGHSSKSYSTENAQVPNNTEKSNSEPRNTELEKNQIGTEIYLNRGKKGKKEERLRPSKNNYEIIDEEQIETESQRLHRSEILKKYEKLENFKNENLNIEESIQDSMFELDGNECLSLIEGSEIVHDKIEAESRKLRRNVENVVFGQETHDSETESPSGFEGISLVKENSFRRQEIAEHNKRKNAIRYSANTSDAISEIHLDGLKGGAVSLVSVDHSFRGIMTSVVSEQRIDGTSLEEVQSLDLLSSSSKSVLSSRSSAIVGVDGIKCMKIPQKEGQKALEAESLEVMDGRKPNSDLVEDKSQDERESRDVKVVLEGDIEKTFFLNSSLNMHQAKDVLSKRLSVISKNIVLKANGRILNESDVIENVGGITMELMIDESEDISGDVRGSVDRPKVVQVKILQEDGTWKYTKVAVMHFGSRKQYMGGYRDKRTGQVYYHVICQTDPRKRTADEGKLVTREVQANLPTVDFGVNTSRIGITQTSKYPLSSPGKIVKARPYIPYNEMHKTMVPHRAAQIIQNTWRKYALRRFISKHFGQLAASMQERANEECSTSKIVHERRVQTMTATIFPSYRSHFSDFLILVNSWAKSEARRLAGIKAGFARKAAMSELLSLEQQMLYVVETQRLKAVEENLKKQDIMFLEGTARSRARIYEKGNVTLIDDLNIQKAGVFKEIFASYSRTDTIPTERLEILNCVRNTLFQEFGLNHRIVVDLMDILDREIDLITIGFPNDQMVYLRKRFETKFLHLARDPQVNPQAKYYRKSHLTDQKFAIRRCKLCNKNLPSSLMFRHIRMNKFRICMSCVQLEQNVATNQLNLAPYKRMLIALRTRELEKNCRSSIPFLLQPLGTYFLVNVIWNGKSILSGNSDLTQLRMTRWLPDQEWSVWNMLLLTEKEIVEHDRIPDPLTHYPQAFTLQVRTKNILGRIHFMYLVDIDKDFKFDRPSMGSLPRDHLLYTNKYHAKFAPSNTAPGFFEPAT